MIELFNPYSPNSDWSDKIYFKSFQIFWMPSSNIWDPTISSAVSNCDGSQIPGSTLESKLRSFYILSVYLPRQTRRPHKLGWYRVPKFAT